MTLRIACPFDQLLPSTSTDTEQVVNTVAALGRRGADVTLLLPASRRGGDPELSALCEDYDVTDTFRLRRVRSLFPMPWARGLEKLAHAIAATSPAFLRGHDLVYTRNLPALIASVGRGRRTVYETYRPWAEQRRWSAPLFRRALSAPECVGMVFHSEYCRRAYVRLGAPADRMLVAYNGHDPERFRVEESIAETRDRLSLPRGRTIFAYAGRMTAAKGLGTVLQLARLHPQLVFLLVGSEGCGEIERAAATIDNVRVLPWQQPGALPGYLHAADVLLIPPVSAPLLAVGNTVLPMKLLGYLAAGRAILAPATADNAELLEHDVQAVLVPPDDLQAASRAVAELAADAGRRARLGRAARERARELTWDARADRLLAFFESRLGSHGS